MCEYLFIEPSLYTKFSEERTTFPDKMLQYFSQKMANFFTEDGKCCFQYFSQKISSTLFQLSISLSISMKEKFDYCENL